MSSNKKTFSTAKLHCTNTALELHFLDDPTNVQSPGHPVVLKGELALECSEPKCLSGTQPGFAGPPPVVAPFELDMAVQLTRGSSGQPSLLATTAGMGTWVPVPVVDASYGGVCGEDPCGHDHSEPDLCGGLCQELQMHRVAAQLRRETRFYVYKVTDTPAELASLRNKLIAVPVVPGLPGNPDPASPTWVEDDARS
jgi:hypothetical protein